MVSYRRKKTLKTHLGGWDWNREGAERGLLGIWMLLYLGVP